MNAHELAQKIIDVILASPLNIPFLDDEMERTIYTAVLAVLIEYFD